MRKAVQRRRLTMQTVHRSDTVRSKWTFYKFLCYRNFTVCTFPSKLWKMDPTFVTQFMMNKPNKCCYFVSSPLSLDYNGNTHSHSD